MGKTAGNKWTKNLYQIFRVCRRWTATDYVPILGGLHRWILRGMGKNLTHIFPLLEVRGAERLPGVECTVQLEVICILVILNLV